jgi:hypothetical protein
MSWSSPNYDGGIGYGMFDRFRQAAARMAGIDLASMAGWGGDRPWSSVSDPLAILFQQNDISGGFGPDECRILADRLRELLIANPDSRGPVEWFVTEFDAAAQTGESVFWS